MKKIKMLAVFLMVVFMLTACGSSSGSSTNYKYSKTYSKTGTPIWMILARCFMKIGQIKQL